MLMRLTTLASSSSGNCAVLSGGGTNILLDAGISMKRIALGLSELGLAPADISGVFITHEHGDHIKGLATMVKRHALPIFAPRTVANHLRWSIPGAEGCVREIAPSEPMRLGELEIACFETPHDTPQSVGYRVGCAGSSVGLCTDLGRVTETVLEALEGVDLAVVEANHDVDMLRYGPYHASLKRRVLSDRGHLSNDSCAELAEILARRGTGRIVLAHLSEQNNTPAKARAAVAARLETAGLAPELYIAPANGAVTVEIPGRAQCSA